MILTIVIFGLLSWRNAFAWSAKGHAVIARTAFEQLSNKDQQLFIDIVDAGFYRPEKNQKGAGRNLSSVNKMGDLAVWPDTVRRDSLNALFKSVGTSTPSTLIAYDQKDTADWHYVNAIFVDAENSFFYSTNRQKAERSRCKMSESGELYVVWPKLLNAFQQSKDAAQQAVVLAFILHLAADAYQPLHVLSGVDEHCDHDRGGNRYCVDPPIGVTNRPSKSCEINLHRLWDQGFKVFDSGINVSKNSLQAHSLSIDYLIKNTKHLKGAYPSHPNNLALDEYHKQGREVVSILSYNAVIFLQNTLAQMASEYRLGREK